MCPRGVRQRTGLARLVLERRRRGGRRGRGLCAGSGKDPYQTVVDLGPRYQCSCPSRKFPCKHALALLLSWAKGTVPEQAAAADFATG